MAGKAEQDRAPPAEGGRARSRTGPRRLSISMEVVSARGAEADRPAEVQLEAIKEVLQWLTEQHQQRTYDPCPDRAA